MIQYLNKKTRKNKTPKISVKLIPDFVSEGSYGCVHRPSLYCKSPSNIKYKNKVSKLMRTTEAKKELDEYILVKKSDPKKQFYLGSPETCSVGMEPINEQAINKCEIGSKVNTNPNNFALIIMKDGGNTLGSFAKKMESVPNSTESEQIMKRFWIESHRIFRGIKAFLKHNICHHDLKPDNILYDEQKNRVNFIDFGLMENIPTSIQQCKNDSYKWQLNWWYFPFESVLLGPEEYQDIKRKNDEQCAIWLKGVTDNSVKENNSWLLYFYKNTGMNAKEKEKVLFDALNFLQHGAKQTEFNVFLEKHFQTFDLYGAGMSLLIVLEKTIHHIPKEMGTKLHDLFMKMTNFNLLERPTIDEATDMFETILVEFDFIGKDFKVTKKQNIQENKAVDKIVLKTESVKLDKKSVKFFMSSDPIPNKTRKTIHRSLTKTPLSWKSKEVKTFTSKSAK